MNIKFELHFTRHYYSGGKIHEQELAENLKAKTLDKALVEATKAWGKLKDQYKSSQALLDAGKVPISNPVIRMADIPLF